MLYKASVFIDLVRDSDLSSGWACLTVRPNQAKMWVSLLDSLIPEIIGL